MPLRLARYCWGGSAEFIKNQASMYEFFSWKSAIEITHEGQPFWLSSDKTASTKPAALSSFPCREVWRASKITQFWFWCSNEELWVSLENTFYALISVHNHDTVRSQARSNYWILASSGASSGSTTNPFSGAAVGDWASAYTKANAAHQTVQRWQSQHCHRSRVARRQLYRKYQGRQLYQLSFIMPPGGPLGVRYIDDVTAFPASIQSLMNQREAALGVESKSLGVHV